MKIDYQKLREVLADKLLAITLAWVKDTKFLTLMPEGLSESQAIVWKMLSQKTVNLSDYESTALRALVEEMAGVKIPSHLEEKTTGDCPPVPYVTLASHGNNFSMEDGRIIMYKPSRVWVRENGTTFSSGFKSTLTRLPTKEELMRFLKVINDANLEVLFQPLFPMSPTTMGAIRDKLLQDSIKFWEGIEDVPENVNLAALDEYSYSTIAEVTTLLRVKDHVDLDAYKKWHSKQSNPKLSTQIVLRGNIIPIDHSLSYFRLCEGKPEHTPELLTAMVGALSDTQLMSECSSPDYRKLYEVVWPEDVIIKEEEAPKKTRKKKGEEDAE